MKNIKTIILLGAIAFTASCTSTDYRKTDAITKAGGATIQGLQYKEGRDRYVFSVIHIDGDPVEKPGYPMFYEIATGERSVGVFGEKVFSENNSKYKNSKSLNAQAEIRFMAKGGHRYEIRGTILEDSILFHIFDLTDDKEASATVTSDMRTFVRRTPYFGKPGYPVFFSSD